MSQDELNKEKDKGGRATSASRNAGVEGRQIAVYWSKTRKNEQNPSAADDHQDRAGSIYHKGIVRQAFRGFWIVDYNREKGRTQETDKLDFVNKCTTVVIEGDKQPKKGSAKVCSWPWTAKGLIWMLTDQTTCGPEGWMKE